MKRLIVLAGAGLLAVGCADSADKSYSSNDSATPTAAVTENNEALEPVVVTPAVPVPVPMEASGGQSSPETGASSLAGDSGSPDVTSGLAETNLNLKKDENISGQGGAAGAETGSAQASADRQYPARLIGYRVIDQQGARLGLVKALWEDESGQPAYLALKSNLTSDDQTVVIPAEAGKVNHEKNTIKMDFGHEKLQGAPTFTDEQDLDADAEAKIAAHFQMKATQPAKDQAQQAQASQEQINQNTGIATAEEATIRLKAEQLKVGKREVEKGGIRLKKIVKTETVSVPVELRSEGIVIERVQPDQANFDASDASFGEKEIYIPLRQEEAVVQKEVVLREIVRVGKTNEVQQQDVSAQVREEQLKFFGKGDADVQGLGGAASAEAGQGESSQPNQPESSQPQK